MSQRRIDERHPSREARPAIQILKGKAMNSQTNFHLTGPAAFLRSRFSKIGVCGIALILTGCWGSDDSSILAAQVTPPTPPPVTYTIGGNLSGLQSGQVTLLLNGANAQTISANGAFKFSTSVNSGANYAVTVGTQPAEQSCSVTLGSGSATANVSNVAVKCVSDTYSVGGTVTGMTAGTHVTLLDNGGNATVVSSNTSFTFSNQISAGGSYAVTVGTQPTGQTCSISHGAASAVAASVSNVTVVCAVDEFSVGGNVTGLATGDQVTLLNNGGNPTTVSANGAFTFSSPVAFGGNYAVTVQVQPVGQTCSLTGATGTNISANPSVAVSCATSLLTTLYSFKADTTDVGYPVGNIMQATDGYFYGTGYEDASVGGGGVFKISSSGTESLLYSFTGGATDGDYPYAGLMQVANGNIYGLTSSGGSNNEGTIFQLTLAGAETVLHMFGTAADAAYPEYATLVEGTDGYLYGTTYEGGVNGEGAVYRIKPDGSSYSVVYSFGATQADGYNPYGGLVFGSNGDLYGVTGYGGANNEGMAFELTTSGTLTALHSFGGPSDGQVPLAALTLGKDGNFYGSTSVGGPNGQGVVFKMTPTGTETVVYAFGTNTSDGSGTYEPLIEGPDGNFYGICYQGGISNKGTFFVVSPTTGQEVILHRFAGGTTDGELPVALLLSSDGHFYGATLEGGTANAGVFFRY
jgi:uncharacterized repeat protein (TIGR03803 family)